MAAVLRVFIGVDESCRKAPFPNLGGAVALHEEDFPVLFDEQDDGDLGVRQVDPVAGGAHRMNFTVECVDFSWVRRSTGRI